MFFCQRPDHTQWCRPNQQPLTSCDRSTMQPQDLDSHHSRWLFRVGAGLLLLLIASTTPERVKSGIDGAGGGVDDVSAVKEDAAPPPPDTVGPAKAGFARAANPLIPARAAPAAAAPARTKENVVEPTSPAMTCLAMKGISAIAKA